jgi:hypothetical protein
MRNENDMFNLDMPVFNYIYNSCRQMGNVIGFGAYEGFIIYGCIISLGVIKFLDVKNAKKS